MLYKKGSIVPKSIVSCHKLLRHTVKFHCDCWVTYNSKEGRYEIRFNGEGPLLSFERVGLNVKTSKKSKRYVKYNVLIQNCNLYSRSKHPLTVKYSWN